MEKDNLDLYFVKSKETEQIFDTPWCMTTEGTKENPKPHCIASNHFDFVAECASRDIAYKVQFLPHLYDGLLEAALGKCWSCSAVGNAKDLLDKGCPKNKHDCYVARWVKILQLIRNGI